MATSHYFVPRRYGGRFLQYSWFLFPLLCVSIALLVLLYIPGEVNNIDAAIDSNNLQYWQLLLSLLVFGGPLCWAFIIATHRRHRYAREYRQLQRANNLSVQHRKQIHQVKGKVRLDMPQNELTPEHYLVPGDSTAGTETTSARMLQQLFTNAQEMRRDSDLTSQVFIRELSVLRIALRVTQQIALRLGIFFTFIGLLVGLGPIANTFQDNSDQTLAIGQLISSLTLAFGTSIAGLGAAMLIQILISVVDRDYSIVTRLLESVWMDLGHTLSFVRFEGDLPANIDRLTTEISKHRESLERHTLNVTEQIDQILTGTNGYSEKVTTAIEQIASNQQSIDTLASGHQQQLNHLASLSETIERYQSNWAGSLQERLQGILEAERQHMTTLQQYVSIDLKGVGQQLVKQLKEEAEHYQQCYQALRVDTVDVLSDMGEQIVDRLTRADNYETQLIDTLDQLQATLTQQAQATEQMAATLQKEVHNQHQILQSQLQHPQILSGAQSKPLIILLAGMTGGLIVGVVFIATLLLVDNFAASTIKDTNIPLDQPVQEERPDV